jgi:hypothetical protein
VAVAALIVSDNTEPNAPYKMGFTRPGNDCRQESASSVIAVSKSTWELLVCGLSGDSDTFSQKEKEEVTALSTSLADDGGLQAADEQAIEVKVQEISARHGYDVEESPAHRRVTDVAWVSVLAGLVMLVFSFIATMVSLFMAWMDIRKT